MSEPNSTMRLRLTQIKDFLTMNKTATTIPWDPNCTKFPGRKELPTIPGAPPEAAWVWGENDNVGVFLVSDLDITDTLVQLGRLNLLTPSRVQSSAKEIKTGEVIPVKYATVRSTVECSAQVSPRMSC